ncbi:hypothetical protein B0A48_13488 [Cryoendolithus antarcticus]|uniref:Uncharacterized protein n=1 Tax=Cryoendolithus antarcticus TaxID=1507870 RepID=A0A1V8SPA1_9PEZI|nr:hypothetical protein B0A48_13488 [Cryoendolithus antarcticus]
MRFPTVLFAALSAVSAVSALPTELIKTRSSSCTPKQRLTGAQLIITSYAATEPGASAAGFLQLPLENDCHTYINPNGGPAVPVAIDAATTRDFATSSRQAFSKVTGVFDDYRNGTTIIHTNVTLGALHAIAVPVTFYADVHLEYNLDSCLMQKIQAFAIIPTVVAGIPNNPPIIDQLKALRPLYKGILGMRLKTDGPVARAQSVVNVVALEADFTEQNVAQSVAVVLDVQLSGSSPSEPPPPPDVNCES